MTTKLPVPDQLAAVRAFAERHPDLAALIEAAVAQEERALADTSSATVEQVIRAALGDRTDVQWGYDDDWGCSDSEGSLWLSRDYEARLEIGRPYWPKDAGEWEGRYATTYFVDRPLGDAVLLRTPADVHECIHRWLEFADFDPSDD